MDRRRWILVVLVVVLLGALVWQNLRLGLTKWPVQEEVALETVGDDLSSFRSGDLLVIFRQGHDFILYPGHMGIVVEGASYGQKFVWDMPIPLVHEPNVVKPLGRFLSSLLKSKSKVMRAYVFHLDAAPSPFPPLSSHPSSLSLFR